MAVEADREQVSSWWLGFRSLEAETERPVEIEVRGQVPADLEGVLYRIGPARHDVYGDRMQHWFDGDGMVFAIALAGGKATYQNRFVETRGKLVEDAARRRIYGSFGTRGAGGPLARYRNRRGKNPANTNIVFHADKLLALCEAGLPHRLDPATLRTLGEDDLGGTLRPKDTFSAHPRLDRATGELWNFGVEYGKEALAHIYCVTAAGAAERRASIRLPFSPFLHDFALTAEHVVMVLSPLALPTIPIGLMTGQRNFAESLRWRPELGVHVAVVSRKTGEVRWYQTAPFLAIHVANAWDDGTDVVIDVCSHPDARLMPFFYEVMTGVAHRATRASLTRLRLSRSGVVRQTTAARGQIDFPRVADRAIGAEHTRIYGVGWGENEDFLGLPSTIDLRKERVETARLSPGEFAGECVPVTKANASTDSDVWLLTLVLDAIARRTELRIYDGADIAAPPVASAPLPHLVPFGFHGNWVRAARN